MLFIKRTSKDMLYSTGICPLAEAHHRLFELWHQELSLKAGLSYLRYDTRG